MNKNKDDILYPLMLQLLNIDLLKEGYDKLYEVIDNFTQDVEDIKLSNYYQLFLIIRYNDPISVNITDINSLIKNNL